MVRRFLLLVPVALIGVLPVQAGGIIFNRKPNPPAVPNNTKVEDRTGDQIRTLRGDKDERRRITAAEGLARYDLRQFPQAGMALIDALQNDPSPNVRNDVAQALGKTRPLTQQVGQALELAFENDSSRQVRATARTSLMPFIQFGYKTGDVAVGAPKEPTPAAAPSTSARPAPAPGGLFGKKNPPAPPRPIPPSVRETTEPPLADPIHAEPRISPPKPAIPVPPMTARPKIDPPIATSRPTTPTPKIPVLETTPAEPAKPAPIAKPAKPAEDGPILLPPE